jgi:flagellar biosynthesis/type III secretory pathway M-ring protein FliF/YscJ
MAPSLPLSLPPYLPTRTNPDDQPQSTKPTTDKKLSTAAGAAILVVFAIFVIVVCLTIAICLARSKRRSRAKETEERNRSAGMQDMEVESTVDDWGSTMGIVKGEVKRPQRMWLPWRK